MVLRVSFSFKRKFLLESIHCICNDDIIIIINECNFLKSSKMFYHIFSLQNFSKSSSAFTAFACSLPEEKCNCSEKGGNKAIHKSSDELLKAANILKRRQVNPFLNCCINKTTTVIKSHVNIRLYEHQLRLSSPLLDK